MDPFIESQKWRDCHTNLMTGIQESLAPRVAPRYVVDVEETVYLLGEADDEEQRIPDVRVRQRDTATPAWDSASTAMATLEPEIHTLPQTSSVRQRYLRIRERRTNHIVTIIEVLSPTNKADGRREYLNKRNEILANAIHLVELGLLRGGVRLPTVEPLRPADYYAFVCRHQRLPEVEVYAWALRQPMPTIPVPLKDHDPDVPLDLQSVFTRLYDRAVYQYSLDYDLPVNPPLSDADAQWVRQALETARRNSGP
jgi:hypothetical protein